MLILISLFILLIVVFVIYAYIPSNLAKARFFKRDKHEEKTIYLTFDDGPSEYTEELLKLLKTYNIKATFFCVAEFAKERKEIIEKIKKDGHVIGLHSLIHKNAMLQGINKTKKDLSKSLKIMKELGIEIKYYRPPWGDSNLYLLKKLKKENIEFVLWDIMAEDWEGKTTEKIIADKLLSRVRGGRIICLHDGRGKNNAPHRTILALKIVLPIFIEKGYKFKTIDEYEN